MWARRSAALTTTALHRLPLLAMLPLIWLLAWVWASYGQYAWRALGYKFGLDYSEGLIWQQVLWLGGPHSYGDISHYPFVVFEYPPLYLLAVKTVAACGVGMLAAGRGVSIVSTLVLCCLIGMVTWRACRSNVRRPAAAAGALVAALLPAALLPVISWSVLMRVDMLALTLTYAGIALATCALRWPRLLYPAVVAFVLAVFTKQIYLAAPVSFAAVMLVRSPAVACRAYGMGALLGTALVAWLSWITGGGFIRHVLLYNVDRVHLGEALRQVFSWLRRIPHPGKPGCGLGGTGLAPIAGAPTRRRPEWPAGPGAAGRMGRLPAVPDDLPDSDHRHARFRRQDGRVAQLLPGMDVPVVCVDRRAGRPG